MTSLHEAAMLAAKAGADVALRHWHDRANLTVQTKADENDLVSDADIQTQAAAVDVISRLRPADRVCAEEELAVQNRHSAAQVEWWIDPIDGTTSFLYGRADWSVSVAAVNTADGRVLAAAVAEPVLGLLTSAELGGGTWCAGTRLQITGDRPMSRALVSVNLGTQRQRSYAGAMVAVLTPRVRDLRRDGSAAAALAQLASGRVDAVWAPGLQRWDGLAGILLVTEAGGTVGDLDGVVGPSWPDSGDVLAAPANLWDELRAPLAEAYGGLTPSGPGT